MGRDFIINGETLVLVKGVGALRSDSPATPVLKELGLAEGGIIISPRFIRQDIHTDDFGSTIPAEVMNLLAEVRISMTLIHTDIEVLEQCIIEAMDGGFIDGGSEGELAGAGALMGRGKDLFGVDPDDRSNDCHYISLNLTSPVLNRPWRFPTAYLADDPVEIPLSATASAYQVTWRAIPYKKSSPTTEATSIGLSLWDHTLDT